MYKCIVLGITLEKLNGPGYGTSRISQSIEVYPCYAFLDFEILRQFTMRFVITTPPTCLIRCLDTQIDKTITVCPLPTPRRGKTKPTRETQSVAYPLA
jgi:hypothetical protein